MDRRLPDSSVHGTSRQEYWSGLPFPPAGDLPHPVIELSSLVFCTGGFFTTSATWESPRRILYHWATREARHNTYISWNLQVSPKCFLFSTMKQWSRSGVLGTKRPQGTARGTRQYWQHNVIAPSPLSRTGRGAHTPFPEDTFLWPAQREEYTCQAFGRWELAGKPALVASAGKRKDPPSVSQTAALVWLSALPWPIHPRTVPQGRCRV